MSGGEGRRKTVLLRPPEGAPEPPGRDKGGEEKPFLDHLEDLRWVLLMIVAAWASATVLAFAFAPRLLSLVRQPLERMLERSGETAAAAGILRSLSPADTFLMSFKLAGLFGLIVSLPIILWVVGRFLLPALTAAERRLLLPAFLFGGGLFAAGVLFAYAAILPVTLSFFWSYTRRLGIRPEWTVGSYVSLVGQLILAFGLAFEFPAVILLLVKLGVVTYDMLRKIRPYAVVIILIVAGVLTPPDVVTQVLMAVPLLALYELCVQLSRVIARKRAS